MTSCRRKANSIICHSRETKPPKRGPGDDYILFGALAGISIGVVIGLMMEPVFLIFGFIVGGIAGAAIGSLLKNYVMRRPGPR